MPVFISYQQSDRFHATTIQLMLMSKGIECYLDVFDVESQTAQPEDVTRIITKNVAKSSHLIAVTSRNTDSSWWVPFEIGEATITGCRIATYRIEDTKLPEYLEQWPAMKRPNDMLKFIEAYEADTGKHESVSMESRSSTSRASADDFHRSLKQKLKY